ncbi:Protein tyrosine phosphatase domain-containing protein 1 [Oopsacas minuta]|uniref:Protein tyrosine phosphatase domain-containing protein 1 n=1 Tax=Oopsacas minuta TaxID=111878 RepID=A0AAV7JWX1_9METZ|nr:Protein tyrosine phosphatase domain-containing protein 1 [Oopsacas minuta]
MNSFPDLASRWYHSNTVMAIRKVAVGDNHCAIFCKGTNCKYEDPNFWRPDQMALQGSFSHWVTDDVMAMSRPTTRLIREYDFIGQLIGHGIRSIFCVQKPGEHSHCGRNLEPSGFSYNPQEVMDAGLYFYNFGWDDFGVPSMPMVLDMVRVVDFAISRGKVAIHCHAGLGRTGVLIACYIVYSRRLDGERAIEVVRTKRPGALQTAKQVELVLNYKQYMSKLWRVFAFCEEERFSLCEYLANQGELLHGIDWKKHKYIPKIVKFLCELLNKEFENFATNSDKRNFNPKHSNILSKSLQINSKELLLFEGEFNKTLDWGIIGELDSTTVWGLLLDWFYNLKYPILSQIEVLSIQRILAGKEGKPWEGLKNENAFNLLDYLTHFISTIQDNTDREHFISDISRVLVTVKGSVNDIQPPMPLATIPHPKMQSILPLCSANRDIKALTPRSMPKMEHYSEEMKTQIITDSFNSYLTNNNVNNTD